MEILNVFKAYKLLEGKKIVEACTYPHGLYLKLDDGSLVSIDMEPDILHGGVLEYSIEREE